MRLQGKTAVVTGGANGIGRATALLFAGEGASVVIADRDVDGGRDCAHSIDQDGGRALFVETDISSEADIARLIDAAVHQYDGVDLLVNNAGVAIPGSVVDTDPDRWQRQLDVNLSSAYLTCRAAIPHMIERGGGAIVNVASLQGMFGWPGWAAYAAAKAGIIGLTRQIAVEYADADIRANSVSPGGIATDLGGNSSRLEPRFSDAPKEQTSPPVSAPRSRLRSPGRPEDVAHAILFFASDEAAHISGQNLAVDGIVSSRLG